MARELAKADFDDIAYFRWSHIEEATEKVEGGCHFQFIPCILIPNLEVHWKGVCNFLDKASFAAHGGSINFAFVSKIFFVTI